MSEPKPTYEVELKLCPFCNKAHTHVVTVIPITQDEDMNEIKGESYQSIQLDCLPVYAIVPIDLYNIRPIEDALRAENASLREQLATALERIKAREDPFNRELSDYSSGAINATLTAQDKAIKELREQLETARKEAESHKIVIMAVIQGGSSAYKDYKALGAYSMAEICAKIVNPLVGYINGINVGTSLVDNKKHE